MLVIGIAGKELAAEEREWIAHPGCAGVILFTRNFVSKGQVGELAQAIREAAPRPQLQEPRREVERDARHQERQEERQRREAIAEAVQRGTVLILIGIPVYVVTRRTNPSGRSGSLC